MSDRPLLTVRHLSVHYRDFHAVRDVSLSVGEGGMVSVVGANGAGKSTLLNTIAGALKPSGGSISFRGEEIGGMEPHEVVSRGISLVPQGRRIFGSLTVGENLLMGFYPLRRKADPAAGLNRIYELFPILRERSTQLAATLSGGEQQMLAIGRALMADPVLLLCDEISLGLAPVAVNRLYQALLEINRTGIAIVQVEHDVKRSLQSADMAYFILEGRLVLAADPATIEEDAVKRAYFGLEGTGELEGECR